MNCSNPCTDDGGDEMNRATSSVVNAANRDGASSMRSSRSVISDPQRDGRPVRQSFASNGGAPEGTAWTRASTWGLGGNGCFSTAPHLSNELANLEGGVLADR